MPVLLHVGPGPAFDNSDVYQRAGNEGQALQSRLHGTHYEACKRGRVFLVSTVVAGLAIPISTTTAPTVLLWNPAGNTKNMVLIRAIFAYVSGTSVASAFGLQNILQAGSVAATGAPITVFAASTPTNGLVGSGISSSMKVSAAGTNTITAQTTWFHTMFGESALIATTAMNPYTAIHDFDGTVIVPPGVAVYPVGSAASGALISQTFIWEEVDTGAGL